MKSGDIPKFLPDTLLKEWLMVPVDGEAVKDKGTREEVTLAAGRFGGAGI